MDKQITDTIPKVDKATYLFETIGWVQDGCTFEEIRKSLIELRLEIDRESIVDQRRGASSSRQLNVRKSDSTFWSNARESLRELIRLGLMQHERLPSRAAQLKVHRSQTFTLTEEGERFLALAEANSTEFRHRFVQAMIIAHPYLRALRTELTRKEFFFPRIQKSDVPGDPALWQKGPPETFTELTRKISEQVREIMEVPIVPEDLETQMRPYLQAAWKRRNQQLNPQLLSKWVVKTLNDTVVRVLLGAYVVQMDFVTFRSAISLLTDLNAIWGTRSLPDRKGWTIWSTSDGAPTSEAIQGLSPAAQALHGDVWFNPHKVPDEILRDKIVGTFFSLKDRSGGIALIHVLRAEVCHNLGIHGNQFNSVLTKMHSKELIHRRYAVNLDRGGGSSLPPSEEPFRIGERAFYLITFFERN